LQALTSNLTARLPASIFVVVHIPPWHPSRLAEVLIPFSPLPVSEAKANQKVERGHIYVARPDYHLLTENSTMHLWRGPRENRHRPAINALFRSAAVNYKERAIGVVLSGSLDDGTTGLWWIKKFGGVTIVQEPSQATFPDMPQNALEHVEIDYVASAPAIGPLLSELVEGAPEVELERLETCGRDEELRKWKSRKS